MSEKTHSDLTEELTKQLLSSSAQHLADMQEIIAKAMRIAAIRSCVRVSAQTFRDMLMSKRVEKKAYDTRSFLDGEIFGRNALIEELCKELDAMPKSK